MILSLSPSNISPVQAVCLKSRCFFYFSGFVDAIMHFLRRGTNLYFFLTNVLLQSTQSCIVCMKGCYIKYCLFIVSYVLHNSPFKKVHIGVIIMYFQMLKNANNSTKSINVKLKWWHFSVLLFLGANGGKINHQHKYSLWFDPGVISTEKWNHHAPPPSLFLSLRPLMIEVSNQRGFYWLWTCAVTCQEEAPRGWG